MTEQAVTEETADRTESTESTDATELDETTEISDTAETEISEETETEKESGTTQILAGTYDAVIGGTYSGVCENQGDYYLYYVTLPEAVLPGIYVLPDHRPYALRSSSSADPQTARSE